MVAVNLERPSSSSTSAAPKPTPSSTAPSAPQVFLVLGPTNSNYIYQRQAKVTADTGMITEIALPEPDHKVFEQSMGAFFFCLLSSV